MGITNSSSELFWDLNTIFFGWWCFCSLLALAVEAWL